MSTQPDPQPPADLSESEIESAPTEKPILEEHSIQGAAPQLIEKLNSDVSCNKGTVLQSAEKLADQTASGETFAPAQSPQASTFEPSFFDTYSQRLPPPPRFPNLLDVALVAVLLLFGFFCSGALMAAALHFHLWGISTTKAAVNDIHYTLGSQAVWYLATLAGCILLFPLVWHTGFFAGVEWRGGKAVRMWRRLLTAVFACFLLALIDAIFLPGPDRAPIDQLFRMPGAAWLLFAFGVTLGPLIEELGFRGFLLPALCTAWDWANERIHHLPPPEPAPDGKARWTPAAMIAASILTSLPFALMHGEQTAWSFGPFILLICVSLVLCWVRLSTRSLAASTVVHASYNLLLFALMAAGTGGFHHLDRM